MSKEEEKEMKISIFMKTYFDHGTEDQVEEPELNTLQEIYLDHLYKQEKNIDG